MDKPVVSVIIPCYNQGKFLEESIQSVLNSAFKVIEIIVVNDGSTDSLTNQLISTLDHPCIRVINTENQGLAKARNTGIRASSGKYILPLDADDKISDNYIEKAVAILDNNSQIKIVTSEVEYFGAKKGKMLYPEYSIECLLARNFIVCTSMFRRTDYDNTDGYNPNMKYGFEDWDFWLSLLESGGEVYRIKEVHFFYRIKKQSMIKSLNSDQSKLELLRKQIYENHKELFSQHYFNPLESFEYIMLKRTMEFRIGAIITRLLRSLFLLPK